ncbi:MAG: glycosyltransferase, partial [Acidobacteriaceae bacterium]
WMRREHIALVQTFFVECNIVGPWLARLAGVPVVVGSRRNLNEWHVRANPWVSRLQKLSNRSADYILGNSEVVADAMVVTEGLQRQKMRVAYNGIDLRKFAGLGKKRARARQMLGIADDEILVGNISCMRRVKGVRQFVDAARLALEQAPDMRFLVVGDGPELDAITEQIRRYGIEDRIHLAGAQTDVYPYLAAMDIGVLSSLAEGFSNSLLEYMAAGLASVATDVGGNREALQETGMLVPPDDPAALAEAILQLHSTPLRQKLGTAARERVEQFSLERAERRMEELYSEMLSSKGILQHKS